MKCPWCNEKIGNQRGFANSDRYDRVNTVACESCKMPVNIIPVRRYRLAQVSSRYHTDEAFDDFGIRFNEKAILPLTPEEALERINGDK